jgi:hypothetical protein
MWNFSQSFLTELPILRRLTGTLRGSTRSGFGDGASILLCNRPCKRFGENFFLDLDCSAIYTRGMKELTNAIKRDFARYAMNCDLAMHHALEDAAGDPERMLALSKLDWCALADHFLDATTASQIKNDRYA